MKILEINQLALMAWAINNRANEDREKKQPLREFIAPKWSNPEVEVIPLLKRWLKKELRWDWFIGCHKLWECGIEPYASNP